MNATSIRHGVYGGLAGGVVFGAMMAMMGMLPMIGNMVGIPSAWVGLFVHLGISATIGGSFAVLLDWTGRATRAGVRAGLAYGFTWWVLGPLTLMPPAMRLLCVTLRSVAKPWIEVVMTCLIGLELHPNFAPRSASARCPR